MEQMTQPGQISRTKRAELLSSTGAGVLGAGLALLFADTLAPYAVAILLFGLLAHVSGMFQKHQLETQGGSARVWWAGVLYWFCWAALAGLLVIVLVRQI